MKGTETLEVARVRGATIVKRVILGSVKRTVTMLLALSLGLSVSSYATETTDLCAYDENKMLELDAWDFDQDPEKGWRRLAQHDECLEDAADLIKTYYENREVSPPMRRLMLWQKAS